MLKKPFKYIHSISLCIILYILSFITVCEKMRPYFVPYDAGAISKLSAWDSYIRWLILNNQWFSFIIISALAALGISIFIVFLLLFIKLSVHKIIATKL